MAEQRFVDWDGLVYYDGKIKTYISDLSQDFLKAGGETDFVNLPRPCFENLNYVYKITEEFTSNVDFEQPNIVYNAGSIVQVADFDDDSTYKYVVLYEPQDAVTHDDIKDFATQEYVNVKIAEAQLDDADVDLSNYYTKLQTDAVIQSAVDGIEIPAVPTKVSELENDAGYVTSADLTDREVYTLNISNYPANQHVTPEQDLILSRLYDEEPHDTSRTPVVVTYVKDTQLDWQWRFITRVSTDPFTGMYDKYLTLYSSTEMHQGDEETSFSNCVYKFAKHSYDTSWFLVNAEKIKLDNIATEQFVKDSIDSINIPETNLSNYYNKTETETLVTEAINNLDIPEADVDLSNYYTKDEVEGLIPDTSNFITSIPDEYITDEELSKKGYVTDISGKADKSDTYTKAEVDGLIPTDYLTADALNEYAKTEDIPTDYLVASDLNGYAKTEDLPSLEGYAKSSDIPDVSNFITMSDVESKKYLVASDIEGKLDVDTYNTDKSTFALKSDIPSVPTKTSELTNDSGFLTEHQDISGKVDKTTYDVDKSTFSLKSEVEAA